jgi:hypothetical protein
MTTTKLVLFSALSLLLMLTTNAATVSSGDLGANVITAGGAYEWSPNVSSPTNELPATLSVTYGLWNDPGVTVHAFVNGTEVGTFDVTVGFFDGPATSSFDIPGLLLDGANTIRFDGFGASSGDYVISSIEVNYNLPLPATNPPPSTNPPPVVVTNPPPVTNGPSGGPFTRRGTSVLHYSVRTPLTPTDAGSNVEAVVKLDLKEQGHSARQKFEFSASHLAANTEYFLLVARGDELDATAIGTFTTDGRGRARISVGTQGNGHGKVKKPSGPNLLPVTDIRAVGIQNGATQTLALAWIDDAPNFEYLVKRNLTRADSNGTAAGWISLKGNVQETNFRLLAGGLVPNGVYYLMLNSNVTSLTANANGVVGVNGWPVGAPALLDARSVALLDGSNKVLLSTTLPK